MSETITYPALLTTLGLAKIAAAIANASSINLTTISVGDGGGSAVTPSASQTALVRQMSARVIDSLSYAADRPTQCTVSALFPMDDGGYTIREFGVWDAENDLIAVGSTPDLPKPTVESGAAIEHVMQVVFDVGNASAVTVELDPSILMASRQWVDDHYSFAVMVPGGTTNQVLTKNSNADGDASWKTPTTAEALVDVVQEKQTLSASQTVVTLSTCTTDGAAVYIGATASTLQRLAADQWTATSESVLTLVTPATGGETIVIVQNEPAAPLTFLRRANDLSEIAADGATAQLNARTNLGLEAGGAGRNSMMLAVMQAIMRVGYTFSTTEAANPATYYGFGTWEAVIGRGIMGVDPGDPDFSTIKTGGSKTHTIATGELPVHAHSIAERTITSAANGGHAHTYRDRYYIENHSSLSGATYQETAPTNYNAKRGSNGTDTDNDTFLYKTDTTAAANAHTHDTTLPATTTGNVGSGNAMSILQPYVTRYIWTRTA